MQTEAKEGSPQKEAGCGVQSKAEAEDEDEATEVQAAVNRCPLETCEANVDHTVGARLHGIGCCASAIGPVGLAGCSNRGSQTSSAGGNILCKWQHPPRAAERRPSHGVWNAGLAHGHGMGECSAGAAVYGFCTGACGPE